FFLKKKKFVRIRFDHLYIPAIIAISFFGGYKIYNSYYEAVEYRNEAIKINENIRKYSQEDLVIPSIGTANQDCALAITTMYGYGGKNGQTYKEIFSGIVSSKIFFNLWENKFFTIPEDLDTKKIFGEKKNVIVQLTSYTTIEAFSEALSKTFGVKAGEPKLIYRNGNGESIYEIEIN
ncbi:MAG: hypothetical protein ABI462_13520, partial [Ignavibacteria bacterium]